MGTAVSTHRARLGKGSVNDWPSLPLLEFTVGLARLMKAKDNLSQADLARRLEVRPPYISSVLSGNENLTIESMSRIAAALDGEIHIAVAEKGEKVRWERDVLSDSEQAPDLSVGALQGPRPQISAGGATAPFAVADFRDYLGKRSPAPLITKSASSEPVYHFVG
jgi:transcriptional regulator with XRE-family HTH domain